MEFSNTSKNSGLVQDVNFHLGLSTADTSSYPIRDKTRNLNEWYRRANTWIWDAVGTWEYDDSNFTDLPIATGTLVFDRQDYTLPSTAQKIERIEIKDNSGNWRRITAIDKSQVDVALTEYYEDSSMPIFYDLMGNSLFLYPKPGTGFVATTSALKVYFSRGISAFSTGDSSTTPGFSENFHRILSLGAALDYALGKNMDQQRITNIRTQLIDMKTEIQEFYAGRHREWKLKLRAQAEGIIDAI